MPIKEAITPLASSRTLIYVFGLALLAGIYALLPLWKQLGGYGEYASIPSQIHAALSLVLGCLLVFRTNTAYNRWWEARTLWGGLVNTSRNAAVKFCTLGDFCEDDLKHAQELIIAFPIALKSHLRSEQSTMPSEITSLAENFQHVPQGLVNRLYEIVARAKKHGLIDGDELRVFDTELHRYLDICGGCERIQRTRIVQSYRVFARQCVLLFLATLPWGMVKDFGWWTIPLTIITAYFMLGLEMVAEHIEEPFGYDEDDLDLEGMCISIENSVSETFVYYLAKKRKLL